MRIKVTPDRIRRFALLLMIPFGVGAIAVLAKPSYKEVLAHGPIQAGHAKVQCKDCHRRDEATLRQQIQANFHYALGNREYSVDFGYLPVTSSDCLDCHERPNERHPIYRFREPRFAEATEIVNATSCMGCHTEHTGQRSFSDVGVCAVCHDDLKLVNDPVDIPHETLVRDKQWQTCLGCHDFHGNHIHTVPKLMVEAAPVHEIVNYLAAGNSPYGTKKLYKAETKQ